MRQRQACRNQHSSTHRVSRDGRFLANPMRDRAAGGLLWCQMLDQQSFETVAGGARRNIISTPGISDVLRTFWGWVSEPKLGREEDWGAESLIWGLCRPGRGRWACSVIKLPAWRSSGAL